MRIAILTLGTRGDVQPYLALAGRLQARGHQVTLAAPDNFRDWIVARGVAFHGLGVDLQTFMQSPEARAVAAGDWLAIRRIWRTHILPMMTKSLEATATVGRDADVLVYHPKAIGAPDLAEATGAMLAPAAPVPMLPTGDFPPLIWTGRYGRCFNRLSYAMFAAARLPYRRALDAWRKETLGLGPGPAFASIGGSDALVGVRLCAVSPSVLPRPGDWPANAHMTGYWFLEEDWSPDPALAAFLKAGPPPIYVGFGSMTTKEPERLGRAVIDAAQRAGARLVLATGWGGIEAMENRDAIHKIGGAPHAALFPHMAAVVHHGGAGTTAAGLAAGKATLICPLAVDQPFWGARVAALGCGPAPLPIKEITADRLVERLSALCGEPQYGRRAAEIADAVAGEDGLGRAADLIESAYAGFASSRSA